MRILLIEDDRFIGTVFRDALLDECYAVDWSRNGVDAALALRLHAYDLLLLDLGLPDLSGMEILRAARRSGALLPVLIMSGQQDKAVQIAALDAGADDYLTKPVNMAELMARVRAMLRRCGGRTCSTVEYGPLTLDLASHDVTFHGQVIKLPRREFSMLRLLLDEPGALVSKRHMEEKLYGWDAEIDSNAIDVHIYQLRKKFGAAFIQTRRGLGYRLQPLVSNAPV